MPSFQDPERILPTGLPIFGIQPVRHQAEFAQRPFGGLRPALMPSLPPRLDQQDQRLSLRGLAGIIGRLMLSGAEERLRALSLTHSEGYAALRASPDGFRGCLAVHLRKLYAFCCGMGFP